jgi:hypothetical protein
MRLSPSKTTYPEVNWGVSGSRPNRHHSRPQAQMWMINEEEEQTPYCPEDSVECASRQSCEALVKTNMLNCVRNI